MELDGDIDVDTGDDGLFASRQKEVSKTESMLTFLPDCILERLISHRKRGGHVTTPSVASAVMEKTPSCESSYSIIAIFDLCGFTKMAEEINNEMSAKIVFTEDPQQRRNTWEGGFGLDRRENYHTRFSMSVGGSFTVRRARKNYKILKSQCNDVQARYGTERLRDVVGEFFKSIMPIIIGGGGDIIRLAGDALIVMFPIADPERMNIISEVAVKAAIVAVESINLLSGRSFLGRAVHMRVVLDMGVVTAAIVGSQDYGWQYIVTGEPFTHLHALLEEGRSGDMLVTQKVWNAISHCKNNNSFSVGRTIQVGGETSYKLSCINAFGGVREGCIKREHLLEQVGNVVEYDYIRAFVPRSVLHAYEAEGSGWFSYIQRVTMVFVKVDVDRNMLLGGGGGTANSRTGSSTSSCGDSNILLEKLQTIYSAMQEVVHNYGGTIKEFTVDDKGLILMFGMGIPPAIGDNQPEKACLVALKLVDMLQKRARCNAWVGISTGMVFTATVGEDRREVVMMGDAVNKAARVMMVAYNSFGAEGKSGILVTQATYDDARFRIAFDYWDTVKVKNKEKVISCYVPLAPIQGGYAVFLPGNFVMVQRYSTNGENVAEIATMGVERLSRGDGGGLLIMEGWPGLGLKSLLHGLANQWKKTFSSNCVKIIYCRETNSKDEAKLLFEYGESRRQRKSSGGGGVGGDSSVGGGEVVKRRSGISTSSFGNGNDNNNNEQTTTTSNVTEEEEEQTRYETSDNNNNPNHTASSKQQQTSTAIPSFCSTSDSPGKVQTSSEQHPLSSWRPVLVSFLLALKDIVLSYAVACDNTFIELQSCPLAYPSRNDSLNGSSFNLRFPDLSDDEGQEVYDDDFIPDSSPMLQGARRDARFSTFGAESFPLQLQPPNSVSNNPESSEDLLSAEGLGGPDDVTMPPYTRAGSLPDVGEKQNSKKAGLNQQQRRTRTGRERGRSIHGYSTAGSMLDSILPGSAEELNFKLLDSVNTMSRGKSAMPDWVNAFGTYPQLSNKSSSTSAISGSSSLGKGDMAGDTPWSRGMFLHFFFDLFMSSKGHVYWLLGDFLRADMPAGIFPNDTFRSLAEMPLDSFPITLADAIFEVLMLTTVGDLVPHMPVSFRAALLMDIPNSLRGPNLELVRRVLSERVLADRFLFVVLSTPLSRTEGDMIKEGKIHDDNNAKSKTSSSKLIQTIQDLKEVCNIEAINGTLKKLQQQQKHLSANFSSSLKSRSLTVKAENAPADSNRTIEEAGGDMCDNNNVIAEQKGGTKSRVVVVSSNNEKETEEYEKKKLQHRLCKSLSNSSSDLVLVAAAYENTKKITPAAADDDLMSTRRQQQSRLPTLGIGGIYGKSKRKQSTEGAYSSMASQTFEHDLLSLVLALRECPHMSSNPNSIQRLQIAPVNFESCRILCAWFLGVDNVTDESAVAFFVRTQGVPLFISKFTELLQQIGVGSIGEVRSGIEGKSATKWRAAPQLRASKGIKGGLSSSPAPKSIWGFNLDVGGLGWAVCTRALSDVRLDGLNMMKSKIEGYLHSLSSQQLNILKILSCIGGISPVPLDLFVSTYHQFVAVSWDRDLEVDIAILSECALVVLSKGTTPNKNEWFIRFSNTVVHQVVYWEIPEKLRTSVHKVSRVLEPYLLVLLRLRSSLDVLFYFIRGFCVHLHHNTLHRLSCIDHHGVRMTNIFMAALLWFLVCVSFFFHSRRLLFSIVWIILKA